MKIHLAVNIAPDWWPLDLTRPERMMGGTERLALTLARLLAERGHNVSFCGGGATGYRDGVRYLAPVEIPGPVDIAIGVQGPVPADIIARRRVAYSHAVQWPREGYWDAVVAVSGYHASQLRFRLPELPITAIPAGCNLPPLVHRTRDRFLYASSPDRGLHRLLSIWPALWRRFRTPLAIAYDLRAVIARHGARSDPLGQRLRAILPLLDQPGVIVHGPLADTALCRLRARSIALLYPLDPVIPHSELFSLSILESCAAGVPPLLTPLDCFPDVYGEVARFVESDRPIWEPEAWLVAVEEVLQDGTWGERARAFAAQQTWQCFIERWEGLFTELLQAPRVQALEPRQSWLVFAVGDGHGESALARQLASAAHARGHHLRIVTESNRNADLLAGPWEVAVEENTAGFFRALSCGADRIVLASSALYHAILPHLEQFAPGVPVVALEYTWPDWFVGRDDWMNIHRLVVALPHRAWQAGLQGESPSFNLPRGLEQRVVCVGPLPDAGRLDVPGPPQAVLYFSTRPGWRHLLTEPLGQALTTLHQDIGLEATSVFVEEPLDWPAWIERKRSIPAEAFHEQLRKSSIVICHCGMATVGAALAAGVRTLMLTRGNAYRNAPPEEGERIAHTLHRCGLVEHICGVAAPEVYTRMIRRLLREPAPPPLGGGASRAVRLVETAHVRRPPQIWTPAEVRP